MATGDASRYPALSGSQRRRAALLKVFLLGMFCWPVQAGMDYGFPLADFSVASHFDENPDSSGFHACLGGDVG
jgi:hypothetical protein